MSAGERTKARTLAQTFRAMKRPASQGGTGGTFTAAATKAGYPDTPAGREAFADAVLKQRDEHSSKMVKKANFYRNVIAN
jgi:hypothetical protein